ncbi:hypothetical protein C8D70_1293 [Chryseobacterium sp. CBTAP 102]|uniref:hypothetical protein n=1 Tax=Chryseobacterium sp. CBTAP 102 TaxID=2135644 RepID=UPI000D7741D1|nr:hypothetical protein [Chryseobacterium sp. CBTAP 102]PXW06309.1 hypothetical protein C8D70_1293 [Chryseobacterium sp. CBTAP 102]
MKKTILIGIGAIIALTLEFLAGYYFGAKASRKEANLRAVEMILNDEIPNYYMVVGTVDYLINNKSGELQDELKKAQSHEKN